MDSNKTIYRDDRNLSGRDRYANVHPKIRKIAETKHPEFALDLIDQNKGKIGKYVFRGKSMGRFYSNNSFFDAWELTGYIRSFRSDHSVPRDLINTFSAAMERIIEDSQHIGRNIVFKHTATLNIDDTEKENAIKDIYLENGYKNAPHSDLKLSRYYGNPDAIDKYLQLKQP